MYQISALTSNVDFKTKFRVEFRILKLGEISDFNLKKQFKYFVLNLSKRVFPVKNSENEHHHKIRNTQDSIRIKFQLKKRV